MSLQAAVGLLLLLCMAHADPTALLLELPHVDDCSLCMSCRVTAQPRLSVAPEQLESKHFEPSNQAAKQQKPFCEECYGCTHALHVLHTHKKKVMFNRTFADEGGASPNWLFVAATNNTSNGRAIVKVACVPVGKNPVQGLPHCQAHLAVKHAKIYLAIEKLAEDCGLTDVVPKVWVEPISAVLPGVGYHIRWHAVWMEQAQGISMENLVRLGSPMMHPDQLLEFMHDKINKTQVVLAAIFDLLTSQCDRHAQNIFIDEDGQIKLIDNERALYESAWCGIDSILLPTTKKYAINVMENSWVNKFANWGTKEPKSWANPPLLLDYRCYVKNETIGTQWPPAVGRCLAKLSGMTPKQVMHEYALPDMVLASALHNRSKGMHEHGFEHALKYGSPLNPNPWRYKMTAPCCRIKHTDTYRCAHEWNPDTALPLGDVIGGGKWHKPFPDRGSYVGGSVF